MIECLSNGNSNNACARTDRVSTIAVAAPPHQSDLSPWLSRPHSHKHTECLPQQAQQFTTAQPPPQPQPQSVIHLYATRTNTDPTGTMRYRSSCNFNANPNYRQPGPFNVPRTQPWVIYASATSPVLPAALMGHPHAIHLQNALNTATPAPRIRAHESATNIAPRLNIPATDRKPPRDANIGKQNLLGSAEEVNTLNTANPGPRLQSPAANMTPVHDDIDRSEKTRWRRLPLRSANQRSPLALTNITLPNSVIDLSARTQMECPGLTPRA